MEIKNVQNNIKVVENLNQAIEYLIKTPKHTTINVLKSNLAVLPESFQKTLLGYSKEGELAQYRGPNNIHVHEYPDKYELHMDSFDPRDLIGALGHIFVDAPEVGFGIAAGLISGAIVGKIIYDSRKESSENASLEAAFWGSMTAISIGLFTFLTVQRYNDR